MPQRKKYKLYHFCLLRTGTNCNIMTPLLKIILFFYISASYFILSGKSVVREKLIISHSFQMNVYHLICICCSGYALCTATSPLGLKTGCKSYKYHFQGKTGNQSNVTRFLTPLRIRRNSYFCHFLITISFHFDKN